MTATLGVYARLCHSCGPYLQVDLKKKDIQAIMSSSNEACEENTVQYDQVLNCVIK